MPETDLEIKECGTTTKRIWIPGEPHAIERHRVIMCCVVRKKGMMKTATGKFLKRERSR